MKNVHNLVESALANLSPITRQIVEWPKNKFMPCITYASALSGVSAVNKGLPLSKLVTVQVAAGKEYQNLPEVKEAIEAGEREGVKAPKGKSWELYPYTFTSDKTGERLVRFYPIKGKKPFTRFFLGDKEITRTEAAGFLQPAAARDLICGKANPPLCYDKRESELIGIGQIDI